MLSVFVTAQLSEELFPDNNSKASSTDVFFFFLLKCTVPAYFFFPPCCDLHSFSETHCQRGSRKLPQYLLIIGGAVGMRRKLCGLGFLFSLKSFSLSDGYERLGGTVSPAVSENISPQPEEKTRRMRAAQARRTKGTRDASPRLHGGLGRRLDKAGPR